MSENRFRFKTSSYSEGNGECVALGWSAVAFAVRDSKNPAGPVLAFGQGELARFLHAVKAGRLDG
ncbi:DUF397 domain-containing protein [Goodfellowiella coeruleoviolacea]|uniref:DUF397 domain-containing protein n=1 Tax=Goodfellowiella coeruleoviolacea TaxID=334858 RepID=A0AAE3GKT4_9PSEU|nr:DUF397 domain-containing protein [Goodfellowiella coeruleoviolacea]MCP2169089.1 protein of unknown function (DUF397) [Goodfellowiella coeruleoviolacea]